MNQADTRAPDTAERHVAALYQAHALSLARLALLMLGDQAAAEDMVQDAFLGLYRRWGKLARLESAETALLKSEEQQAVIAAIRRLPTRQREALVLRYYLNMTEDQAARLQRAWPVPVRAGAIDLSWIGDRIVGFDVIYAPNIHEDSVNIQEVRTLDINAPGTGLFADSHVVWSHEGFRSVLEVTPGACYTPFLSGNGQTVVCASFTRSGRDQRLSAEWLAYAVATPTKPRVLASILMPKDVSGVAPESVEWTNASGTKVIGTWSSTVTTGSGKRAVTTTANFIGLIEGGTITRFPFLPVYPEDW